MLQAPVGKTLRNMTIPLIAGIVSVLLIGVVDTFFVSMLGTLPLAAIGFTFPVSFIVMNIVMGFAVGLSAVLSKTLGEGNEDKAKHLTSDSLLLSMLVIGVVIVIGIVTIKPVFTLIGASQDVLVYIQEYMVIWFIAALFLTIPLVGNGAIRATGDMKTPSMLMIFSAALNAILDPILIFGIGPIEGYGIQGAALATLISWMSVSVLGLWVLHYKKKLISFKLNSLTQMLVSWKLVLGIALPAALSNLLVPVSTTIITAIIATQGVAAVAAYGVGTRIEALAFVVVMALSTALLPFIGQNLGAKKNDRVLLAVSTSLKFGFGFQLLIYLLLALCAPLLASTFSNDPAVIELIILFLWIVPLSYSFHSMVMLMGSTMNALNKATEVLVLNIIRLFVLFVPFAYFGAVIANIQGLFIGLVIASVIAALIGYYWLRRTLNLLRDIDKTQPGTSWQ